jgi:4'-phosphopantetheinyl transferase
MIRTYIFNKNELEKVNFSEEIFSADRKEKISKLKRDEDKQLSECAELILIYALKNLQDITLPLELEKDSRDKLFLKDMPYYFNLSHAGDYAACAVSDSPVGVDIEYFRVKDISYADRMLYPEEAATLAYISNPNEKKKFFYECWVAKESYLKNLGIGLVVRPRDFMVNEDKLKIMGRDYSELKGHHSVSLPPIDESKVKKGDTTLLENLSLLEKRYVHVFEPGEVKGTDWKFDAGYRMAVCSLEKDTDSTVRLIHADEINSII